MTAQREGDFSEGVSSGAPSQFLLGQILRG